MKKLLPIVLLLVGISVFLGVYFFVVRKPNVEVVEDEDLSDLIEVAIEDRPVAVLVPRSDGHWWDLTVSKLGEFDAEMLEYELVYVVPGKGQQGTGGTVPLNKSEIHKEILIGTESSGNYYYDSGVEEGTLTLKFRNEKGKLVAKFATGFHFQSGVDEVATVDGKFSVKLDDKYDDYFVTMDTFGYPDGIESDVLDGPYGVFSSNDDVSGTPSLEGNVMVWSDVWNSVSGESPLGIFVRTSK